jgi:glutamate racemase
MVSLLIVDSGLGGLTVLGPIQAAIPEADITYVADDAGFPYGAQAEESLREHLIALIGAALSRARYDCVVIACNTASTLAIEALRAAFALPFVGTVPAIKPAAALTRSGLVAVLATPGTIQREYTHALIAAHGAGADFLLIGAPRLASLAEADARGEAVPDEDIAAEIAPCFVEQGGRRADVVVLGCTHYPLLMERLPSLASWPAEWLDPAPAIARRTANLLAGLGHVVGVGARPRPGTIRFTSGRPLSPALLGLLARYHLTPVVTPLPMPAPLPAAS